MSVNNFDDSIFEVLKLCLNKNVSLYKFDIRSNNIKKGFIKNFRKWKRIKWNYNQTYFELEKNASNWLKFKLSNSLFTRKKLNENT